MKLTHKAMLFILSFSLLFVSASPVFAIPGQLINDLVAPTVPVTCVCDDTPLNTCNSLREGCEVLKTEQEAKLGTLTKELAAEKQIGLILKIALGGVVVGSALLLIFLKKG